MVVCMSPGIGKDRRFPSSRWVSKLFRGKKLKTSAHSAVLFQTLFVFAGPFQRPPRWKCTGKKSGPTKRESLSWLIPLILTPYLPLQPRCVICLQRMPVAHRLIRVLSCRQINLYPFSLLFPLPPPPPRYGMMSWNAQPLIGLVCVSGTMDPRTCSCLLGRI